MLQKISGLPTEAAPTDDDFLCMVDNLSGATKRITVSDFMQRPAVAAFDYRIDNGTTTRSVSAAGTNDIPGTPNFTITAGKRAIKLHVHFIMMANCTTGGGQQAYINVNGTNRPAGMYFNTSVSPPTWDLQALYEMVDIAAGASATIKTQWAGAGLQICNKQTSLDAQYPAYVRGWVEVL